MKSIISLITLAVLALLFTPASFAEDCDNVDNSEITENDKQKINTDDIKGNIEATIPTIVQ
jgi:hypothetical protein